MRTRFAASALAILISFSLLAPMAFFTAPQHAEAALATLIVGGPGSVSTIKTAFETMITAIRTTISSIAEVTTAAAQVSQLLNTWVLQPLAFILSGQLLKALTAGVISFVIGKANGTGLPQFAVDVQRSMQTVADSRALAYLQQIGQTNSPFASSISSALRNDYLQKTTLAGFWAANMCTLAASSPNVSAYLAGDWSQGGIAEWFALTTQSQNNPYLFYPIAQTQLQNVIGPGVGGATGARLAELGWGSGFASWCGAGDSTTSNDSAEAGAAAALQECSNNGGTVDQCSAVYETYLSSKVAISPGDTCTQSDGTPGVIKTPGSTIKSTLDKVLGSQQDKLVQMGNIGPEINLILGNIATVMQTVMLASNILGGSESDGLLGFGNTSSTGSPSPLSRFQNTQGYMGVGSGQVYQGAANLPSSGSDMLGRVDQYRTAWNTITSAANTASTSVSSLASHCLEQQKIASTTLSGMSYITGGSFLSGTSQMSRVTLVKFIAASGAQAIDAQTALTNLVAPVLARAATAASVITAAQAMVQKIQGELSSGADTAGSAYAADMQTLQTMPPSATDVATIEQESQAFEIASANPDGSLNVSGGSLVDQMNLLNGNAITLKATVCNPNSTLYTGMSLFGG